MDIYEWTEKDWEMFLDSVAEHLDRKPNDAAVANVVDFYQNSVDRHPKNSEEVESGT